MKIPSFLAMVLVQSALLVGLTVSQPDGDVGMLYPVAHQIPGVVAGTNGSLVNVGCTGSQPLPYLCQDLDPGTPGGATSFLVDGNIPTVFDFNSTTWARELMTVFHFGNDFFLSVNFDAARATRVELVVFNCPDWEIGAVEITVETVVTFSDVGTLRGVQTEIGNRILQNTSCDSLLTICLPLLPPGLAPAATYTINVLTGSDFSWTHIAEIAFYEDSIECADPFPVTPAPTEPSTSTVESSVPSPSSSLFVTTVSETMTPTLSVTDVKKVLPGVIAAIVIPTLLILVAVPTSLFCFRRKQSNKELSQELQLKGLYIIQEEHPQIGYTKFSDSESHVSISSRTCEDSLPQQEENAMIESNNQDRHHIQFPLIGPVQVLQFDSAGGEHVIPEHDITLIVPEGAVPVGRTINLEYGVHLHGPFQFPTNTWPISAVLWISQQEDDVELAKPIQIIMPHFLCPGVDVTQLQFVKTSHCTDKNDVHFCSSSDQWTFFSKVNHCGYGVLDATHCCYNCITAHRKLKGSEKFALTFAHPIAWSTQGRPLDIFIIASYFLPTCFKAISDQVHKKPADKEVVQPPDMKVMPYRPLFHFDDDRQDGKLIMEIDDHSNTENITVNPPDKTVNAEAINYTNIDPDDFPLMHELGTHPPRITLTFMDRNKAPPKIVVNFSGISGPQKQRIDAEIPLPSVEQSLPNGPQPSGPSQPSHQLQAPSQPHSRGTPSPQDLQIISKAMNDWRPLSNLMNFSDAEQQEIEQDNPTENSKKIAMLNKWKRKRGSAATFAELVMIASQNSDMVLEEKIVELAAKAMH